MPQQKPRKRNAHLYSLIGGKIRALRETREVSQENLAARAQLKRPSMVLIELGKQKLPIDRLYEICAALDVEPTEVLPSVAEVMQTSDSLVKHGSMTKVKPEALIEIRERLRIVKEERKQ